jgi:predicted AAA+ superfamily ATPase
MDKLSFEAYETKAPNFRWIFKDQKLTYEKLPLFLYIVLMILFISIVIAIFYYKRYKDPLVIKLSQNPEMLCDLFIEELKTVEEKLSKIERLKPLLLHNSIGFEQFRDAIEFEKADFDKKAKYFARKIEAKVIPIKNSDNVFVIEPDESFPLNIKSFMLFMSERKDFADMLNDIKKIPQYKNNIILILTKDSIVQKNIYHKNLEDYEKFVVPKPEDITRILLCEDAKKQLATLFANQLTLTQISPYQLGGGVNRASMFFGREKIISYIIGRDSSNYMFIGSRQIGKSSLLKALHREYQKRGELSFYISLNGGELLRGIKTELKLKSDTLEEIVSFISKSEKSYILLIDEADKFIKNEKENDYRILDTFRKLSEEGKCSFILAGFWEL